MRMYEGSGPFCDFANTPRNGILSSALAVIAVVLAALLYMWQ